MNTGSGERPKEIIETLKKGYCWHKFILQTLLKFVYQIYYTVVNIIAFRKNAWQFASWISTPT